MLEQFIRSKPWESSFFGMRIGEIDAGATFGRGDLPALIAEARRSGEYELLWCSVDLANKSQIGQLETSSFSLTDIRIEYQLRIHEQGAADKSVRLATLADTPSLCKIADQSLRIGRFFSRNFPEERARDYYRTWVSNAVSGEFDDVCLVYLKDQIPVGFITGRLTEGDAAIGLLAVAPTARGNGIGKLLLRAFDLWGATRGGRHCIVATQGENIPAQNLYASYGYKVRQVSAWYCRSFPRPYSGADEPQR